jgi:hypothetical protein
MNIFLSSFSFSSSSIQHFTSLSIFTSRNSRSDSLHRTSRNSRFDRSILIISWIIRTRSSFSRFFNNILVDNFFIFNLLFTSSSLLFDCSSLFDFVFSFSSSLLSISNWKEVEHLSSTEKEKSNSKNEETLNLKKKNH